LANLTAFLCESSKLTSNPILKNSGVKSSKPPSSTKNKSRLCILHFIKQNVQVCWIVSDNVMIINHVSLFHITEVHTLVFCIPALI
jgi:hypothetical protein